MESFLYSTQFFKIRGNKVESKIEKPRIGLILKPALPIFLLCWTYSFSRYLDPLFFLALGSLFIRILDPLCFLDIWPTFFLAPMTIDQMTTMYQQRYLLKKKGFLALIQGKPKNCFLLLTWIKNQWQQRDSNPQSLNL